MQHEWHDKFKGMMVDFDIALSHVPPEVKEMTIRFDMDNPTPVWTSLMLTEGSKYLIHASGWGDTYDQAFALAMKRWHEDYGKMSKDFDFLAAYDTAFDNFNKGQSK